MKPVLKMEDGKPVEISLEGVPEQPRKPKRGRLVIGLIAGLLTLVVIALVTGLSVYFGAKLTRDNYKEARQLYHLDDGKSVEQVSKVSDSEVTIKVPNVVETVFDYKNGFMVERHVNSETRAKSACFARYLNETTAPSRDADRYLEEESTLNRKTVEQKTQKWQATSRKLSKHLVSESVAKMCEDTDIFWMEKVNDDIEKRAACVHFYYYVCYPRTYRCSYYCYFDNYCTTASGYTYFWESEGWYCLNNCYPGSNNPVCP